MRRVVVTVEYDGRNFCGWQRQKNGISVQQCLEEAIEAATGARTIVEASGRTDKGVHAFGQAVHFDTETAIPDGRLADAINGKLERGISVVAVQSAPSDFHARYDAKRKTYRYKLYCDRRYHPLYDGRFCHIRGRLNAAAMAEAAKYLVGEHDFRAFMATGGHITNTVRTLYSASVSERYSENNVQEIEIEVTGNGFLYNMVRIIAGTLVQVGRGKYPPEEMKSIIESCDRVRAGKTLVAEGLYLVRVEYDGLGGKNAKA